MSDYQDKIHKDGPDKLVVESGGVIEVKSGGAISNAGDSIAVVDPADHVADASVTLTDYDAPTLVGVNGTGSNAAPLAGTQTALDDLATKEDEQDTAISALETKINAILAALQDAGIMADS